MSETKSIATRLQSARKKLQLSQSKAAKAWKIGITTLQAWEQGRNEPRGLYLEKVEQILKEAEV